MTLLQWKDQYSVGIEAVDHEHKELIDLINRLHGRLQIDNDPKTITIFLGDVLAGISAHFALEEKFMREHRYDQLGTHKGDHERLLDEIRDITEDYVDDPQRGRKTLAAQLEAWFGRHFETHDARLHHRLGVHPH